MIKYKDVKNKCLEGRFFKYDNWRDKLFVPPSIFLIWFFLNIGLNANAVSILSGLLAILCGFLMSFSDPLLIFIGSFGYVIFYLLDYVDGGVARYHGKSGIGGQYLDWIMHVVVTVGITTGIFIGALQSTGLWIIPFGILCIISSLLTFDKHSYAWYSIIMYYQQNKVKGKINKEIKLRDKLFHHNFLTKSLKAVSLILFHENYTIFFYPVLGLINLYFNDYFDFRVIIVVWGGSFYFIYNIWDLIKISKSKVIDKRYNETFIKKKLPKLPGDHFFN